MKKIICIAVALLLVLFLVWFFVALFTFGFRHPWADRNTGCRFYLVEMMKFQKVSYAEHDRMLREKYPETSEATATPKLPDGYKVENGYRSWRIKTPNGRHISFVSETAEGVSKEVWHYMETGQDNTTNRIFGGAK